MGSSSTPTVTQLLSRLGGDDALTTVTKPASEHVPVWDGGRRANGRPHPGRADAHHRLRSQGHHQRGVSLG
jgi:hypothetical protein